MSDTGLVSSSINYLTLSQARGQAPGNLYQIKKKKKEWIIFLFIFKASCLDLGRFWFTVLFNSIWKLSWLNPQGSPLVYFYFFKCNYKFPGRLGWVVTHSQHIPNPFFFCFLCFTSFLWIIWISLRFHWSYNMTAAALAYLTALYSPQLNFQLSPWVGW